MNSPGAHYATGDQWRNNSRKNEETEPKQKQYPVVDVTGDESEVRCCKEQYYMGTWNATSMNQGKLEVVKQEMYFQRAIFLFSLLLLMQVTGTLVMWMSLCDSKAHLSLDFCCFPNHCPALT